LRAIERAPSFVCVFLEKMTKKRKEREKGVIF
jgi:hypothetical protein